MLPGSAGYRVEFGEPWADFPTGDADADSYGRAYIDADRNPDSYAHSYADRDANADADADGNPYSHPNGNANA